MTRYRGWMDLAAELGFVGDLRDLMKLIPHKQYKMWVHRRTLKWNEPSLTDNYIMSLRHEVRSIFSKTNGNLSDYKLKFSQPDSQTDPTNKSRAYVEWSKQMLEARLMREAGPRPGQATESN